MTDNLTPNLRSWTMSQIKSVDTRPERAVRSFLHKEGYHFRLHRKDLPGKPDLVFPRHKIAVFVNGCFWHRHRGCKFAFTPKTAIPYWRLKFQKTVQRDKKNRRKLVRLGWDVMVIWECDVKKKIFERKLLKYLTKASQK